MDVNWFPGHMTRALREIKDSLKLVDMVIETCDARIPISSRNPELLKLINQKPSLLVFNKSDLADPVITKQWQDNFKKDNQLILTLNALNNADIKDLAAACKAVCESKLSRVKAKGILNRPVRAMLLGIPNTGKSTIINSLCGKKVSNTSDRPGVTRAKQWVRTQYLELMDMPGVLWPKLGSQDNMLNLAATGAVKDQVIDIEEIAFLLMQKLLKLYPDYIMTRFKITQADLALEAYNLFLLMAKKRACIMSGGRIDQRRFAILFVDEFRAARIGRISLERPEN